MDPTNPSNPGVNNDSTDQSVPTPVSAPEVTSAPPAPATDIGSAPVPPMNSEPPAVATQAPQTSEPMPAPADPAVPAPAALPATHKKSPAMLIGLVGLIVVLLAVVAYFAFAG